MGADVYATVGSDEKVQHLMAGFDVPRDRIFNSRDDSFARGLMQATHNKGVDLVLNSLSGELLHATWQCVAPFGRMIEIGKRDLLGFGQLDMTPFLANRTYSCVDIEAFREKPAIVDRYGYYSLDSLVCLIESTGHYKQSSSFMSKSVSYQSDQSKCLTPQPPAMRLDTCKEASTLEGYASGSANLRIRPRLKPVCRILKKLP